MKITPDLFEAFLKCPTKCWLLMTGEPCSGNAYAECINLEKASYRSIATERLLSETPIDKSALSPLAENLKVDKWHLAASLAVQAQVNSYVLATNIHAVERLPSEGRGKRTQLIPIRSVFTNKVGTNDKLLLAFDSFILSETLEYTVSQGKIIHGDDHARMKVKPRF